MAKIAQWFDKTKTFLGEVRVEMKKVTWPTQVQVKNYTAVVIIASIALAIVIGIFDRAVAYLLLQATGIGVGG